VGQNLGKVKYKEPPRSLLNWWFDRVGAANFQKIAIFLNRPAKMLFSTLFSVGALLVAEASAHGAVTSYVIGSTTYPG
jgi:hypothetical protein